MNQEYFNIEKILDRRKINGRFEYLIKWEGYPVNESTWEPIKNLKNAKPLLEEYDKAHSINIESENQKKKVSIINNNKKKKVNEEITTMNKDNEEKSKIKNDIEVIGDNNDENSKILIYENENSYNVDSSLTNVATVKKQNGKLMAIVEKIGENGQKFKTYIPTEELRKINPWILLQFYESKIKFT